jgi:hypothetical protein
MQGHKMHHSNRIGYWLGVCAVFISVFSSIVHGRGFSANSELSIFVGSAVPIGEFGRNSVDNSGYAETGFCMMLEAGKELSEVLAFNSSATLTNNGFAAKSLEKHATDFSVSAGNYNIIWAMSGLTYAVAPVLFPGVYVIGQVGLMLSKYPNVRYSTATESIRQTTRISSAYAICLGSGIVKGRLNFSLRYYRAEPEYQQIAGHIGELGISKMKISADNLQILIGLNF